ncbi:TetR/AcrR family transcriptional regulator [Dactylosporangium sp. CA-139066]|uniref:SbtR family transcriptional regulator n=1 Tax=Dactylosporangium sp. CA-139066 TaxID=3239930 RepID=UPI003D93CC82
MGWTLNMPYAPSAAALLQAVFRDRVQALCAKAHDLATRLDPWTALTTWLRAVGTHATANRGLAAAIMSGTPGGDPTLGATCHTMIVNAGDELLVRARHAGSVRPDVTTTDLLKLVSAIALAAEPEPDSAADVDRLVALAIEGVRPRIYDQRRCQVDPDE